MTWLLKIEFETKECLDDWVERNNPYVNVHRIIDVEYEELEED